MAQWDISGVSKRVKSSIGKLNEVFESQPLVLQGIVVSVFTGMCVVAIDIWDGHAQTTAIESGIVFAVLTFVIFYLWDIVRSG